MYHYFKKAIVLFAFSACFVSRVADAAGQCYDKPGMVQFGKRRKTCKFISRRLNLCSKKKIEAHCPVVCESECPSCVDKKGKNAVQIRPGVSKGCRFISRRKEQYCGRYNIGKACARSCDTCLDGCQDHPNNFVIRGIRTSCSEGPAEFCSIKKYKTKCKKKCNVCIVVNPGPPTQEPTPAPSPPPTSPPGNPTNKPTTAPTVSPGSPTNEPTTAVPTVPPTQSPTVTPGNPTNPPTRPPTRPPTNPPTNPPTMAPAPTSSFAYGTDEIVL